MNSLTGASAGIHLFDLFRGVHKVHWLSIWSHGTTPPLRVSTCGISTLSSCIQSMSDLDWTHTKHTHMRKEPLLERLHVSTQQSKQACSGSWLSWAKCKERWRKHSGLFLKCKHCYHTVKILHYKLKSWSHKLSKRMWGKSEKLKF